MTFVNVSSVAFLVFTLPTEINDTIRAFRPSNSFQATGAVAFLTAIFIAMGQFNHAIHFYIYTLTGGIFRNELIKLFTLSNYNLFKRPATSTVTRITNDHPLLLTKAKQEHRDIDD